MVKLSNVDLNIQTGADFINSTTIDAETVTIEVTNFANDIANTGTISATSLNIIFTDDLLSSATSFNGFNNFRNLAITADGNFTNFSTFDLDNLTINVGDSFGNYTYVTADSFVIGGNIINNYGFIAVDSLTVTANYFINTNTTTTINATSFTATVAENFNNITGAVINTDSFTLTAKNFNNTVGATINADTVTIEVPNFASNINNVATVSADSLNLILTADFTHESDFFYWF